MTINDFQFEKDFSFNKSLNQLNSHDIYYLIPTSVFRIRLQNYKEKPKH